QNIQDHIQTEITSYTQQEKPDLPQWVYLSQRMPDNALVKSILKGRAFTQRSYWTQSSGILNFRQGEFQRHDPLSLIATTCYGDLKLKKWDFTKIMESRYDVRHHTHRRLWRGSNLTTSHVHTVTQVYATQRFSYQELTLTIKNHHTWKNNQQEAVYSFYLPEGAAVTSLSLWINGKEEKSRLTTRAKADSAYVQIVGVERRDPALLHWQEGNRVTVTVFPCTPAEDRKVKIGFSAPLHYDKGRLTVQPVAFDGPDYAEAESHREVHFMEQPPRDIQKGWRWHKESDNMYQYDGAYNPQNSFSFEAPELSKAGFNYKGKVYQPISNQPTTAAWTPETIILDIHAGWSLQDFEMIWAQIQDQQVYVFAPQFTQMTQ
ncbi:MAG: XrtN system VIT domain-containing protein, partial [Bacteroidota bacterium]